MIKAIATWLTTSKLLSRPRKYFMKLMRKMGVCVWPYLGPKKNKIIDLIDKIKLETEMLLFDNEAYQLFKAVKSSAKIEGDLAEVGVYKGGSAKLICEAKGNKFLHLFDTFEGFPSVDKIDKLSTKGQYAASLKEVKNYLDKYHKVHLYKGEFSVTAKAVKDKKFSFVHLDVDLYRSTLNCLEFFYPRMNKGGMIMSHDYLFIAGVRKAIDDFFKNKLEPIIETTGSQCLIVKL